MQDDAREQFIYQPIGVVRSPHAALDETPIQPSFAGGIAGAVEIDPRYREALVGIDDFSHIILIVALHKSDRVQLTVTPFLADESRGLFATRAPCRPNAIGLSIVRLVKRDDCTLHVDGIDILDGTPVLDVKPYVPQFDIVPDAREGWVGAVTSAVAARRGRRRAAGRDAAPGPDRASAVSITVVVDNSPGKPGLKAEHGLSLWIEAGSHAVLFDTGAGAGEAMLANSVRLDVSLEEADAIVLSHGHYDHSGGLAAALARARFARVVAHPAAILPRWARTRAGRAEPVGMSVRSVSALLACAARTTWSSDPIEVVPGVHTTGAIPRRRDDEPFDESFFLDQAMSLDDRLPDDQALWIETPTGPVVVVGCAHSGLLTTLDRVAGLRGDEQVRAVVGGTHLLHARKDRLEMTLAELERRGATLVAPGHCTGKRASALFAGRFGERCLPLHVGRRLVFD